MWSMLTLAPLMFSKTVSLVMITLLVAVGALHRMVSTSRRTPYARHLTTPSGGLVRAQKVVE
jgi:hypothetical protein